MSEDNFCEKCGEKFIGKLVGWTIKDGKLYHDKCIPMPTNQEIMGALKELGKVIERAG